MTQAVAPYDLHLHSYWSYDAMMPPEGYFRLAREHGVRCIAITDHHVLDGMDEFLGIAQRHPDIRWIPAGEFSVTTSIGSVDLLCYWSRVPRTHEMRRLRATYYDWQRRAGEARSRGLMALGIAFTDQERLDLLRSYRPHKALALQGNTHVRNGILRQYLTDRGHIKSPEDYKALMSRAHEAVRVPSYPAVAEVVPVLKDSGGYIAIAHPRAYFAGCDPARMDALCAECRLDGIECAHLSTPVELTPRYRDYCRAHGLFSVGGSDCHTEADCAEHFGRHGGDAEWEEEFMDRLEGGGGCRLCGN